MDLDRFKKSQPKEAPKKRSVNGGEQITNGGHKPIIIRPNNTNKPQASGGNLFDDDKDIFGVWKKQDTIKQQRKEEEAAAKAAKKAAKQAKKLEKQRAKRQRIVSGAPKKVELSLTVPTIKPKKFSLPGYRQYKKAYISGAILVALPIIAISVGALTSRGDTTATNGQVEGAQTSVSAQPDFATLKPTTVENQATEPKYDGTKKVASYNDVLDNVPITISQQPLPTGFQSDPTGKVADLAKQINANDKISTSDTTAYSGLSAKGPQTIVFTKNDLLVFIYADKKINTLSWSKYIESMR